MDGSIIKVHCRAAVPSKLKREQQLTVASSAAPLKPLVATATESSPTLGLHTPSSHSTGPAPIPASSAYTHASPEAAANASHSRPDSPARPATQPHSTPTSPKDLDIKIEPGLRDCSSAPHSGTKRNHPLSPQHGESAVGSGLGSDPGVQLPESSAVQASAEGLDSGKLQSQTVSTTTEGPVMFSGPEEQVQKRVRV